MSEKCKSNTYMKIVYNGFFFIPTGIRRHNFSTVQIESIYNRQIKLDPKHFENFVVFLRLENIIGRGV